MLLHPFPLLEQFNDRLRIALFLKEDCPEQPLADQQCAEMIGVHEAAELWQVHGSDVIVVREPRERTDKADGMMTDTKRLALCVRTADCQQLLVYDPVKNVVGMIHAGWRGVVSGVIPNFFEKMKEEWSVNPSDVYVAAGPSLCQKCADFSDPEHELPNVDADLIDGKYVDLQNAATQQLKNEGVNPDHIVRHPNCTRCHPETYWTYRGGDREQVKSGLSNILVCALI